MRHAAWRLIVGLVVLLCAVAAGRASAAQEPPGRILVVVGPSSHPPGTHEVAAGARLVEHCLENAANVRGLEVDVIDAWPQDRRQLEPYATVVFTGDQFPGATMPDSGRILADLSRMMDRGCGIVCIHYATGLGANHVPEDGAHPLLHWMGGYFATRTPHHQSIARLFTATIRPAEGEHPVLRGWKPFTLDDEPYINNYFGKEGIAENVTPLAVADLPPEAPRPEVVAWAVTRDDGGRGAGIVMPHYYRNWKVDDLRMLILNAVVWSAGHDVPAEGVRTQVPDLAAFAPASVEPQPRQPQP